MVDALVVFGYPPDWLCRQTFSELVEWFEVAKERSSSK